MKELDDYREAPLEEQESSSLWKKIFRGFVALLVIAGLFYISGAQQALFFRKTPTNIEQTPVTALVDAETITVPLTVFIIEGADGSERNENETLHLVEQASRIWEQAAIELEIRNLYFVEKDDEELREFYREPHMFITSAEQYDPDTVNVFLVRHLGGINGVALGGTQGVAVADRTTTYDFRVLAHEVGHTLGLGHVSDASSLMSTGASGIKLSLEEIGTARSVSEGF